MNANKRRESIIQILSHAKAAVSGTSLAKQLDVSRQIIVQDIALLRASGKDIYSTNRGYVLRKNNEFERVFKVQHTDQEVEEELQLIVDMGGKVKDVFVYHKVYGVLCADMNIKSRMDIKKYMRDINSGKSSLLKNVTSGFHYHTVVAESEELLDLIQEELNKRGFLAKLQDYEPVNFWGDVL